MSVTSNETVVVYLSQEQPHHHQRMDPTSAVESITPDDTNMNDTTAGAGDSTQCTLKQDVSEASPHFITVTVSSDDADPLTSHHQGYHVQYVDPEIYASAAANGDSTTLYATNQGPYYAAAAAAATPTPTVVGYTAAGQYIVQQTVEAATIINSAAAAAAQAQSGATSPHQSAEAAAAAAYITAAAAAVAANGIATASPNNTTTPASIQTSSGGIVTGATQPATGGTGICAVTGTQTCEEVSASVGHVTRVSPATVQWLLENYETAEGVSLPRSTLYSHYLRHCGENKLDPVNAASFGKLIRSVFLGLRTRRLGTRGNSKYHYYGIRVKPGSELNNTAGCTATMTEDGRQIIGSGQQSNQQQLGMGGGKGGQNKGFKRSGDVQGDTHALSQHISYLGDGSNAIPPFPDITFSQPLPDDCSFDDVDTLKSIYREHLEAFLDAILSLDFNTVETLWREFWRTQDSNGNSDECEEEKYLSKSKLFALCALEPMQEFMKLVDFAFYQNLIQVLIPDVLKPIPASLTQSIRNFAKSLDNWLTSAMTDLPADMLKVKLSAATAFSSSLRRYTSLNHLAQAARAVLHNGAQIAQMLSDLNRVDFHSVREQAAWICQCDHTIVARLEQDFKLTLQQQNSLEQWASWLKNVVKTALKPYEGKPIFSKAARQFLLKWSFYSSMVIRDLTLRSAASFGSFHLIRLLYDEYMFYLIEHQVAEATGTVPIAVMVDGSKHEEAATPTTTVAATTLSFCNNDELNLYTTTNDCAYNEVSQFKLKSGEMVGIMPDAKRSKKD